MQNFKVKEVKQCFSKLTKNSKKRGISLSKHWICAYKSHLSGTALKPRKKSHSERNATIHKNYIKLYTKHYFKQKNWVFTRESLMNTQYGAGDRTWTGTVLLPRDFKSLASADFATPAYCFNSLIIIYYEFWIVNMRIEIILILNDNTETPLSFFKTYFFWYYLKGYFWP